MKEVNFKGNKCIVKKTKYTNNDNLALVLIDKDSYELYAKVTINLDEKQEEDVAYVKDYSENEGIFDCLDEAGLVKEVIKVSEVGRTVAPLVRFDLSEVENL